MQRVFGLVLAGCWLGASAGCKPDSEAEYPYGSAPQRVERPAVVDTDTGLPLDAPRALGLARNEPASPLSAPEGSEGSEGLMAPGDATEDLAERAAGQGADIPVEAATDPPDAGTGGTLDEILDLPPEQGEAPPLGDSPPAGAGEWGNQPRDFEAVLGLALSTKDEQGVQTWTFRRGGYFDWKRVRSNGDTTERRGAYTLGLGTLVLNYTETRTDSDPETGARRVANAPGESEHSWQARPDGTLRLDNQDFQPR